ncbi:hypothetical protein KEJ19_03030 [Candidatus Bathyarchaeota archaeon]|nr:hypothetical protein [Candidatus Bathyarchaeota archaeon]
MEAIKDDRIFIHKVSLEEKVWDYPLPGWFGHEVHDGRYGLVRASREALR